MPRYDYSCEACGTYEVEQRITAPALSACEKCGGKVKRLISKSSFALKGSGWYADGYASSGSGGSAGSACATPSACGAGGCAKAEA